MTDEELAAIKARVDQSLSLPPNVPRVAIQRIGEMGNDALRLLAEVERLTAREAALVVEVQAVADGTMFFDRAVSLDGLVSSFRDKMLRARALLGAASGDTAMTGEEVNNGG